MYYLLGWIVGDIGKTFTSKRLLSARLAVELTKVHAENIPLGELVGECVKELGISWIRHPDKKPSATNLNGAYRWQSLHSSAFGWFHTACLGLGWTERTTTTAVKMEWLFTAPPEFRIQFLRGIADSDGSVHFRDKEVDIVTQPNTHLIATLFQSRRRKILEKLTNARTFQRHWPRWLQVKAEILLNQGLKDGEICEKLLEEDNVCVKYKTIRGKRRRMLK